MIYLNRNRRLFYFLLDFNVYGLATVGNDQIFVILMDSLPL